MSFSVELHGKDREHNANFFAGSVQSDSDNLRLVSVVLEGRCYWNTLWHIWRNVCLAPSILTSSAGGISRPSQIDTRDTTFDLAFTKNHNQKSTT
jgi:hypothetical protein